MAELQILEAQPTDFLHRRFQHLPGLPYASRTGHADRIWREGGIFLFASLVGGKHRGSVLLRPRRTTDANHRVLESRKFPERRYFCVEKGRRRSAHRATRFRTLQRRTERRAGSLRGHPEQEHWPLADSRSSRPLRGLG